MDDFSRCFTKRLLGVLPARSVLPVVVLFLAIAATHGVNGGVVQTRWVGSWAASQQLVEPDNALGPENLHDVTLRQIVHLSLGGTELRLRLSNRFSGTPLHLTAVHVARAISPNADQIVAGSDRGLTFSGSPDVTIPAHADYISDPVSVSLDPLADLAITFHIEVRPLEQTGHPGSRAASYIAPGALVSAIDLPAAKTAEHWYFIAGVDVAAEPEASAIVALGDSITDGHGATTNGNNRWTDVLAQRLQTSPGTRNLAVLNQGISGNRLLSDGLGPNALSRFDSDVIAQTGIRYLIVLEGINDIGMLTRAGEVSQPEHDMLVRRMLAAYEQIVARAHSHGIKVIGATLLPFVGSEFYKPGPRSEADRQAVNEWIRDLGHFDAVIDFDKIMRDPEHPERLLNAFDSGDHLHPSPTGYAAMANGIALSLFGKASLPAPKIAITFDDLPAHGPLPSSETRIEVISRIIAALREAKTPPAYGFVNGAGIELEPGNAAVLQAWRSAGNLLASHTWSHMNLNQHSLEEFEQDVGRDEPALANLMKNEDWHWFRYPFLAEGDTLEKTRGFREFLRKHGYKIAAVTMSFGDYLWNEPYARCKAQNNPAAITALGNSYLDAARESIDDYRSISHTLYGRDIPYVLLMHIGAFDAEMLPELLQLYRDRGFEFVTLEEAERDQFYRAAIDLNLPADSDTLERAMSARHLPLPLPMDFAAMLDSVCR
jgi:lysophospholipase L1-like esterase